MKIKLVLIFIIILIGSFISSCKNCSGFEDKCKGEHTELEWVVVFDSTCSTLGQKKQICSKCQEVITTATIPFKEHTVETVTGLNPTCTLDGFSDITKCNVCNINLSDPTIRPALGHNYLLDNEKSTTTLLVYVCDRCNDSYEVENTSGNVCGNNHTPSDWIITLEPTCKEFGSANKICTKCEIELEIKSLEKLPHTEEVIKGKDAICEASGLTDGIKCSKCDTIIKEQTIIEQLEHDYKIINTVSPTEKEDGYIEYKCNNCNDTYQTVISSNGNYDPEMMVVYTVTNSGFDVVKVTAKELEAVITENTKLLILPYMIILFLIKNM